MSVKHRNYREISNHKTFGDERTNPSKTLIFPGRIGFHQQSAVRHIVVADQAEQPALQSEQYQSIFEGDTHLRTLIVCIIKFTFFAILLTQ